MFFPTVMGLEAINKTQTEKFKRPDVVLTEQRRE